MVIEDLGTLELLLLYVAPRFACFEMESFSIGMRAVHQRCKLDPTVRITQWNKTREIRAYYTQIRG